MSTPSESTPPDPLDGAWFVHLNGKTHGPFSGHEIQKRIQLRQVSEETLFYPKGGSNWIRAKSDPVLGTLFKKPDDALQLKHLHTYHPRKIAIAVGLLVCAAIAWLISPYYALYDLAAGLREGDISTLEARVDWETVRQGLRDDLNAILLQKAKSNSSAGDTSAFGVGLAVVLGPAIVNNLVDGYVTPQAVSKIALANNPEKNKDNTRSDNPEPLIAKLTHDISRIDFSRIQYAFFSGGPRTFKIEVLPDSSTNIQSPMSLILKWDVGWRLTRIFLPPDLLEHLPNAESGKKTQRATTGPTGSTTAASIQQPIEISLVNKRFKSANFEARDYNDNITFELSIKNVTDKDVRAFDGTLTFTDLLGNYILSSKLAINEVIGRGATLNWNGSINFNQFMDSHKRLRDEAQDNLRLKFETRKILFTDGTTKEY